MKSMMNCYGYVERIQKLQPWLSERAYQKAHEYEKEMNEIIYYYSGELGLEQKLQLEEMFLKYPDIPAPESKKEVWEKYLKEWENAHYAWLDVYAYIKFAQDGTITDKDKEKKFLRIQLQNYFETYEKKQKFIWTYAVIGGLLVLIFLMVKMPLPFLK